MSNNTFGNIFRVTTFGESHGPALGCVIDGMPAGIKISQLEIQRELNRRRPGFTKISTSRREADHVEILSGIFQNKTTGAPIALLIHNTNTKSSDYTKFKNLFRPGHADFTWFKKFGFRDFRGGGRSSGRETAARVAAGAVAQKILSQKKIKVIAFTEEIANIRAEKFNLKIIEKNSVRAPDSSAAKKMEAEILAASKVGDSVGGIIGLQIKGAPAGLGEPVFDKLDALLSHALLSIGAVKAIEFGAGFALARMRGSEANDEFISFDQKRTNHAGGILGGISDGSEIYLRLAVKPTASIALPQKTIDVNGHVQKIKISGRHDPCIVPRLVPVAEAMVRIVLADLILRNKNYRPLGSARP
jgi:chorismate synthase